VAARLLELGRVALAVMDIEAVRDCLLPHARAAVGPDEFAYDIDLCNTVKGRLLRVERLTDLPVLTAVWRVRPDQPAMADVLLAGSGYPPQLISWDKYTVPMPEAMRQALDGDPGTLFSGGGDICSVFVPLRDSLDDVVAVLELCSVPTALDAFI
jgi:hypothetical protein